MSTDSDLRESIERTKQAFRSGQEASPTITPAVPASQDRAPRPAGQILASLHPFFIGLLQSLPEPGTDWPQAKREQWLETARNIFGLIYGGGEQPVEPRPLQAVPPTQFERRVA